LLETHTTQDNADACLVLSCTSRPMLVWTLSRLRTAPTRLVSTSSSVTSRLLAVLRTVPTTEVLPKSPAAALVLLKLQRLARTGGNMACVSAVSILCRGHNPPSFRKVKHV
jgi:glutamate racemase